ncbi:hypothetical protein T02_13195 [Trichinella nativa]|uniref:Uncharacterized protein n=1 Tax=Trichinella nativa TaxID=6335 RepID=A0A0V1L7Q7_9BILA|nr:hypothetical protein T02_13195 [Trichinella nativa]
MYTYVNVELIMHGSLPQKLDCRKSYAFNNFPQPLSVKPVPMSMLTTRAEMTEKNNKQQSAEAVFSEDVVIERLKNILNTGMAIRRYDRKDVAKIWKDFVNDIADMTLVEFSLVIVLCIDSRRIVRSKAQR